ncbi:hypothetical protein H0H81_002073, partial [Sphagnurus paluster]
PAIHLYPVFRRKSPRTRFQLAPNQHPTVDVRGVLTPALGPSIAAQATPHVEGTGGLYLAEGGGSQKVLLVTARHVLFPPSEGFHVDYARTNDSAPRRDVFLLGTRAYDNLIESIKIAIRKQRIMVELDEQRIENLQKRLVSQGEDDVEEVTNRLQETQESLNEAIEAIEALQKFHDEVKTDWRQVRKRVIGHVVRSPPITVGAGTEGFSEDYAIVELDSARFKKAFKGNVIDLGTKIPLGDFMLMMHPRDDATTRFIYPANRLLPLRGVISEDLMRNPDVLDEDGEASLFVVKNDNTTGVTIGRATGSFSYGREYFGNNTHRTSKEWAILPYDGKSGSIIVDGRGQIGGLLTGGAGKTESLDITYATPFFWLFPRIKANGFPNAHLDPEIA